MRGPGDDRSLDAGGGAEPASGGSHRGGGFEVVGGPGEVEGRGAQGGDADAAGRASRGRADGTRASRNHAPDEGTGRARGKNGVHRIRFDARVGRSVRIEVCRRAKGHAPATKGKKKTSQIQLQ